jgi:hypothetical protein
MKKVIALSTVLALGALGMACDSGPANTTSNNTNKPATPASTPASTPATTAPNTNGGTTAPNTNGAKPADSPAKMDNTNANKKP